MLYRAATALDREAQVDLQHSSGADVCEGVRVVREGHAWGQRGIVSDPLADTRANLASQLVGVFVAHRHRSGGVHDGTTEISGGGVHGLVADFYLELGKSKNVLIFPLFSTLFFKQDNDTRRSSYA